MNNNHTRERNEEVHGKVPISIVSRLDVYMSQNKIRFSGEVLAKALDAFLPKEQH